MASIDSRLIGQLSGVSPPNVSDALDQHGIEGAPVGNLTFAWRRKLAISDRVVCAGGHAAGYCCCKSSSKPSSRYIKEEMTMSPTKIAALACFVAASAIATSAEAGSVDEVIKSGVLRACTPGDYKPFSFAMPTARSKESMSI